MSKITDEQILEIAMEYEERLQKLLYFSSKKIEENPKAEMPMSMQRSIITKRELIEELMNQVGQPPYKRKDVEDYVRLF